MLRRSFSVLSAFILIPLTACTTTPESDPAYISPSHYDNYNCSQISAEMQRITGKLDQAEQAKTTGQILNTALSAYAISQGFGVSGGNSDNDAHRRLVNQYDVLEQTAIRKECAKNAN